jgi:hypothetical protein
MMLRRNSSSMAQATWCAPIPPDNSEGISLALRHAFCQLTYSNSTAAVTAAHRMVLESGVMLFRMEKIMMLPLYRDAVCQHICSTWAAKHSPAESSPCRHASQ